MVMEGDNGNGNGHDPGETAIVEGFRGARLNLDELRRADGVVTQLPAGGQGGVLHRTLTAEKSADDYRQELKTATFASKNEIDNFLNALSEAKRYGCSLDPLHDWLIGHSAGVNAARLRMIFETLSHTTVTTNYTGQGGKHWWSNDKSKKSSPLS